MLHNSKKKENIVTFIIQQNIRNTEEHRLNSTLYITYGEKDTMDGYRGQIENCDVPRHLVQFFP